MLYAFWVHSLNQPAPTGSTCCPRARWLYGHFLADRNGRCLVAASSVFCVLTQRLKMGGEQLRFAVLGLTACGSIAQRQFSS
jgi:hypothetical protein